MAADSVSNGPVETYKYVGLNTILGRHLDEARIGLYYYDVDNYRALDHFGRVIDQGWKYDAPIGGYADQFKYTYDQVGHVLQKQDIVNPANSALYHEPGAAKENAYDPLGRVNVVYYGAQAGAPTPQATKDFEWWHYDVDGNWISYKRYGKTYWRVARTAFGMVEHPPTEPGAPRQPRRFLVEDKQTFDGWERLTSDKRRRNYQSVTLQRFEYDALGRRTYETMYDRDASQQYENRFYFDAAGHPIVETRTTDADSTRHENVYSLSGAMLFQDRFDNSANRDFRLRIYPLTDAQGNVTTLLTKPGNVWQPARRFFYYHNGVWRDAPLLSGEARYEGPWNYLYRGGYTQGANFAGVSDNGNVYHLGSVQYDGLIGHTLPLPSLRDGYASWLGFTPEEVFGSGPSGFERWFADKSLFGLWWRMTAIGTAVVLGGGYAIANPYAVAAGASLFMAGIAAHQYSAERMASYGADDTLGHVLGVGGSFFKGAGLAVGLAPAAGYLAGAVPFGGPILTGIGLAGLGWSGYETVQGYRQGELTGWDVGEQVAGLAGGVLGGYWSRGVFRQAYGRGALARSAMGARVAQWRASTMCFSAQAEVMLADPADAETLTDVADGHMSLHGRRWLWAGLATGGFLLGATLCHDAARWRRQTKEEEEALQGLSVVRLRDGTARRRESALGAKDPDDKTGMK